jgi:hypothetical protein
MGELSCGKVTKKRWNGGSGEFGGEFGEVFWNLGQGEAVVSLMKLGQGEVVVTLVN